MLSSGYLNVTKTTGGWIMQSETCGAASLSSAVGELNGEAVFWNTNVTSWSRHTTADWPRFTIRINLYMGA